jgi:predicted permease
MVHISVSLLELSRTFLASLRSIGTAVTMASVGFYLHQTNSVGADGKRTLAVLSQQVTFPLFLFTKIIYCNQDWSDKPCPDVMQSLSDVWMLLFWPIYVVGVGLLIGMIVSRVTSTRRHHMSSVLAACAFGNSTGLPITLLNVIHANFPSTSNLGRIDPTLFLSVFLLLYPVLQWGLGGWLLAPDCKSPDIYLSTAATCISANTTTFSNRRNGSLPIKYLNSQGHRKVSSADEGLYLSEL